MALERVRDGLEVDGEAFAARFADTLAESPIEFSKTLRLARAAHLLTRTDRPVKTVAAQVGARSRSSFTTPRTAVNIA